MAQLLRKILIIDDDPFFLKVLTDTFSDSGFTVFNANDGIEGVTTAEAFYKPQPKKERKKVSATSRKLQAECSPFLGRLFDLHAPFVHVGNTLGNR